MLGYALNVRLLPVHSMPEQNRILLSLRRTSDAIAAGVATRACAWH
jgi:hypothetical protein